MTYMTSSFSNMCRWPHVLSSNILSLPNRPYQFCLSTLPMFSSTLIIRTTRLISLMMRWMMPANNMVIDARVMALDNLTDLIRQVLNRVGTPLHCQSLEFIWRSGVQAMWLLESHLFPDQSPQTRTELSTPSGNPHSFRFLAQDDTFQAYVGDLMPSWDTLLQFSDYLHQVRGTYDVPQEILDAVWDASLILENLGLIFGIDFLQTPSNTVPADVGGTADNAAASTTNGTPDQPNPSA